MVSINLTTRGSVDIATVWVLAPPQKYLTPLKGSPGVIPVAAKTTSSARIRSSSVSFISGSSNPYSSSFSTCERSEEHTSELQSRQYLVCRLLLEKKKQTQ